MSIFSTHKIIKLIKNQKLLLILLSVFFHHVPSKATLKACTVILMKHKRKCLIYLLN